MNVPDETCLAQAEASRARWAPCQPCASFSLCLDLRMAYPLITNCLQKDDVKGNQFSLYPKEMIFHSHTPSPCAPKSHCYHQLTRPKLDGFSWTGKAIGAPLCPSRAQASAPSQGFPTAAVLPSPPPDSWEMQEGAETQNSPRDGALCCLHRVTSWLMCLDLNWGFFGGGGMSTPPPGAAGEPPSPSLEVVTQAPASHPLFQSPRMTPRKSLC